MAVDPTATPDPSPAATPPPSSGLDYDAVNQLVHFLNDATPFVVVLALLIAVTAGVVFARSLF